MTCFFTPIETLSENYVYQKESLLNDEENSNISSCNLSLLSIENILPCFGDNKAVASLFETDSISAGYQYHYYLEIYESNFPLNGGGRAFWTVSNTGLYTSITTIPFAKVPQILLGSFLRILQINVLIQLDTLRLILLLMSLYL